MATVMQSGAGETLTVADVFVHAMTALGWEAVAHEEPEAKPKARRSTARSRKPAEDQED